MPEEILEVWHLWTPPTLFVFRISGVRVPTPSFSVPYPVLPILPDPLTSQTGKPWCGIVREGGERKGIGDESDVHLMFPASFFMLVSSLFYS